MCPPDRSVKASAVAREDPVLSIPGVGVQRPGEDAPPTVVGAPADDHEADMVILPLHVEEVGIAVGEEWSFRAV